MQFSREASDVFVPNGAESADALRGVTHLCIGAHADDIEIMAHSAICACLEDSAHLAFGGVVVTDGGSSSRVGPYADKTDAEMKVIRAEEQREAARLGRYAIQIQLSHLSATVKDASDTTVVADLATVLAGCSPREVLLHNPADKHDTHVAVLLRSLRALRQRPLEERPERVFGVEVWRGLDWMVDSDKIALNTSGKPELRARLLEVFDSQIFGGKRYDLATEGRRSANATFHDANATDEVCSLNWAMDLTPVVRSDTVDLADYTLAYIDRLRAEVKARFARLN